MQVVVTRHEQHAAAGGNAAERNETYERGNAERAVGQPQAEHAANDGERQPEHDDARLTHVAELAVEKQEDDHQRAERGKQKGARGSLLALELTAVLDAATLGQGDALLHGAANVGHHATHVAPRHVGRDDHLARHVFAVDGVGAGRRYHLGHVAEGDGAAAGIDGEMGYAFHGAAVVGQEAQREVEHAATVVDRRNRFAAQQHVHHLGKLRQRDAVAGQHFAARHNLQLRTFHLLLHVEVGQALYALNGLLHLLRGAVHAAQVVAEHLDGDAGLRAAQHGVDAVGDGGAHLHIHAGHGGQTGANVGHHLVARALVEHKGRFNLRGVHAQGMLVEFGASRLASHGAYFRHTEQQLLHAAPHAVRLCQRDARPCGDVHRERTFVERRKETAAQLREGNQCAGQQYARSAQHPAWMAHGGAQQTLVVKTQPARDARLAGGAVLATAQQKAA